MMDSVKISDRRELGTVNVNRMARCGQRIGRKLRTSYVTVDKKKRTSGRGGLSLRVIL